MVPGNRDTDETDCLFNRIPSLTNRCVRSKGSLIRLREEEQTFPTSLDLFPELTGKRERESGV